MECYAIVEIDGDGTFRDDPDFSFDSRRQAEESAKKKPVTEGRTWIVLECNEVWASDREH